MDTATEKGPGAAIRAGMANKGYTRESLAKRMGVSPEAVGLWMTGRGPNRGNLNRLAKVLGCRPGDLI